MVLLSIMPLTARIDALVIVLVVPLVLVVVVVVWLGKMRIIN